MVQVEANWPSLVVAIAVNTSGLVYVSERENNRISVFTLEGKFVKSFGKRGKEPGEFDELKGLAVDSSGALFVCDCFNDRVNQRITEYKKVIDVIFIFWAE